MDAFATYVTQAEKFLGNNQVERAIALLKKADALVPNRADVNLSIGRLLRKMKKGEESFPYYQKANQLDPDSVEALLGVSQGYKDNFDFDNAEKPLQTALKLAPHDPTVQMGYGNLRHNQLHLEEAITHYRKALELRLQQPTTYAPQPTTETFDPNIAEPLMWETLSQLAKAGTHAFACFGTLLAMHREGALFPLDHDLDFGIPYSEQAAARNCLEANGWVSVEKQGATLSNPIPYFHPVSKITLDLTGFAADETRSYDYLQLKGLPIEQCRLSYYPPLMLEKALSPDGDPLWKLTNIEAWLDALYGDWHTPDPNFDTIICGHNIIGFSHLTQCYAFMRIFMKWRDGEIPKALSYTQHTRKRSPDDALLQQVETHLQTALATHKKTAT